MSKLFELREVNMDTSIRTIIDTVLQEEELNEKLKKLREDYVFYLKCRRVLEKNHGYVSSYYANNDAIYYEVLEKLLKTEEQYNCLRRGIKCPSMD